MTRGIIITGWHRTHASLGMIVWLKVLSAGGQASLHGCVLSRRILLALPATSTENILERKEEGPLRALVLRVVVYAPFKVTTRKRIPIYQLAGRHIPRRTAQ